MAGEAFAVAALAPLINTALKKVFGDPEAEAQVLQTKNAFIQKSLSLGIPVKRSEMTGIDPAVAGLYESFQQSPGFKNTEAQHKQQLQTRQGIAGPLQAFLQQQPGGQGQLVVPSAPGGAAPLFQQGSPFGQLIAGGTLTPQQAEQQFLPGITERKFPTPTDVAAREAQLTAAAEAKLTGDVKLGQLSARRLDRIATKAAKQEQLLFDKAKFNESSRQAFIGFSAQLVSSANQQGAGLRMGDVPIIAKHLQAGTDFPARIADAMPAADLLNAKQLADFQIKLNEQRTTFSRWLKSKAGKNAPREDVVGQAEASNTSRIFIALLKSNNNVASAELEYRKNGIFVNENGKLVRFDQLSEPLRQEAILFFRDQASNAVLGGAGLSPTDLKSKAIQERNTTGQVKKPEPVLAPPAFSNERRAALEEELKRLKQGQSDQGFVLGSDPLGQEISRREQQLGR